MTEYYSGIIKEMAPKEAEKLTAMCRYIYRSTGVEHFSDTSPYQLTFGDLRILIEFSRKFTADALCLAFDYGRAMGYRAASSSARKKPRK